MHNIFYNFNESVQLAFQVDLDTLLVPLRKWYSCFYLLKDGSN